MPAIRWYVDGLMKRCGIQVVLDFDDVGRWPRPIETALFRVVQESLTNVHRHASTQTASIRLAATADAIMLDIQDEGHGLRDERPDADHAPLPATLGVGVQGMRERIRQLDGTFTIEFTERGTTVRTRVPGKRDDR